MKVKDIRVTVVVVPFSQPETWVYGRCWGLTNAVLEVETDEGIIGLGEAPGHPSVDIASRIIEMLKPAIIDHDPFDILAYRRRVELLGSHHFAHSYNIAAAAIEIALWDIVGKASGQPLNHLFGGLEREWVPYYWYLPVMERDVETVRAQAAEGVALGFRTMYLKIGFDVANDLALARAIREEVGPDIAIRVDANEAWSPLQAIKALRAFEEVGLEFLEQPIDMNDLAGAIRLRQSTTTPIGANQSAWEIHHVPQLLASGAADVIVTDPHQLGGLSLFRDVAAMCETAHMPLVKHSFGDLGITTAATLHVLGGLPGPPLANQTHFNLMEHDMLATPFAFEDGCLHVPSGPGLGIELDRDALDHYAEIYETVGEPEGYGGDLARDSNIPASLRRQSVIR